MERLKCEVVRRLGYENIYHVDNVTVYFDAYRTTEGPTVVIALFESQEGISGIEKKILDASKIKLNPE